VVNFPALVEEGVISPGDIDLMHFVDTAEEAWAFVQNWYAEA
jgi:predicted Rossmann-fold nucleotide-binding protein